MPKRNLIWIAAVVAAGVVTVLLTRTPPPPSDPDMARLGPLSRAYRVLRDNACPAPSDVELQQGAVRGMVESLDQYSSYIPPQRVASFRARLAGTVLCTGLVLDAGDDGSAEVVGALPGSSAHEAQVPPGGRVTAVDGNDVTHLDIEEIRRRLEAPRGKLGPVEVTIADPADPAGRTYRLDRRKRMVESVTGLVRTPGGQWDYYFDDGPRLAYVRVREFLPATSAGIQQALRELPGLRGLVLDLRDNPGGRLESGFAVANLFLRDGVIFTQTDGHGVRLSHVASADGTWPNVPMVVLANARTASAAEIVAGSLKLHGRAVLVGERTQGKGTVQSMIELPDDLGQINVTTGEFFLGLDVPVARRTGATDWGVDPHVSLPLSPSAERARRRYWLGVDVWPGPAKAPATQPATVAATQTATSAIAADAQLAEAVRLLEAPAEMRQILSRPASRPATAPSAPASGPRTY